MEQFEGLFTEHFKFQIVDGDDSMVIKVAYELRRSIQNGSEYDYEKFSLEDVLSETEEYTPPEQRLENIMKIAKEHTSRALAARKKG
jgi:hypothetical protein